LTESPGLVFTIIAFALVLGPLVFVHELGHYAVGRLFGVKADEFSIGFGRALFSVTDRRGTRWKFGWLPLGGYVKFAGDMDPSSRADPAWLALPAEKRAETFQAKPVWQRALIVAAGPLTNLLLALIILGGFAVAYGDLRTPPVVGEVQAHSAAASAGLKRGDRIVAVDGRSIATFETLAGYVRMRPGKRAHLDLLRSGAPVGVDVVIGATTLPDRFGNAPRVGRLGIGPGAPRAIVRVPLSEAPAVAFSRMGAIIGMMGDTIAQIVRGERSAKELGGPLQIAKVSGEQLALGPAYFVFLIALVSINLGFINLLPVPVLDGGHLMFYAIEAVRRRPLEPQVQEWAFRGGLAAVLALMLFVTANDLSSLGVWRHLTG